MKTTITCIILSVFVLTIVAKADELPEPKTYQLRVTSATPGKEVKFTGSYVFPSTKEKKLFVITRKTPFECSCWTRDVGGFFRTTEDEQSIKVELYSLQGDEKKFICNATGKLVILQVHLSSKQGYFIVAE